MRLEDLVPLHTVHDLETVEDDPDLWKAHSSVPLEDDGEMCDQCPYCLDECGDELRRDSKTPLREDEE